MYNGSYEQNIWKKIVSYIDNFSYTTFMGWAVSY